jgi:hypothetical protein
MTSYSEFLKSKEIIVNSSGFSIATDELCTKLFDWQKDIVKWCLKKGRSAIFADCGLRQNSYAA